MEDLAAKQGTDLRSKAWFANPDDPGMTALYLERYLNFGLTLEELSDPKRPIIGIAQTGSDMSPCNRHHLDLEKRVRDGIIAAGGTPLTFPCHPIQETGTCRSSSDRWTRARGGESGRKGSVGVNVGANTQHPHSRKATHCLP